MLALSAGAGKGPAGGLGEVAVGGGALGSAVGNGAGAGTGLSSPSNAVCRCKAASARNWATGGSALREGSMGRDIPCKQKDARFCSDSNGVNRARSPQRGSSPNSYQIHSYKYNTVKR